MQRLAGGRRAWHHLLWSGMTPEARWKAELRDIVELAKQQRAACAQAPQPCDKHPRRSREAYWAGCCLDVAGPCRRADQFRRAWSVPGLPSTDTLLRLARAGRLRGGPACSEAATARREAPRHTAYDHNGIERPQQLQPPKAGRGTGRLSVGRVCAHPSPGLLSLRMGQRVSERPPQNPGNAVEGTSAGVGAPPQAGGVQTSHTRKHRLPATGMTRA